MAKIYLTEKQIDYIMGLLMNDFITKTQDFPDPIKAGYALRCRNALNRRNKKKSSVSITIKSKPYSTMRKGIKNGD